MPISERDAEEERDRIETTLEHVLVEVGRMSPENIVRAGAQLSGLTTALAGAVESARGEGLSAREPRERRYRQSDFRTPPKYSPYHYDCSSSDWSTFGATAALVLLAVSIVAGIVLHGAETFGSDGLCGAGAVKIAFTAFWMLGPPAWFWIEYNLMYLYTPRAGRIPLEDFKYSQDTASKIWLALVTVLLLLYFGKDLPKREAVATKTCPSSTSHHAGKVS
jgi:hypothetical protein